MRAPNLLHSFLRTPTCAALAVALCASVACREAEPPKASVDHEVPRSTADLVAAEEAAAEEAAAEEAAIALAAAQAEAKKAQEQLEAAQQELAARQTLIAEQEQSLRRQEALREQQAQLAAREAAFEERERYLVELERDLEVREINLAVEQDELREREEALAVAGEPSSAVSGGTAEFEPSAEVERDVEASLLPGKVLEVEILETLSSRTSRRGDNFAARLVQDLRAEDGTLVIAAGAEIIGKVVEVIPLKRVGGRAALEVEFTHVVVAPGETVEISASFAELGSDQRKNKKKILGAAAAGAILGRVLGGKGTGEVLLGAAAGAAAGAAVVARAEGKDAEIQAGQMVALQLEEVVTVSIEMTGVVQNDYRADQ